MYKSFSYDDKLLFQINQSLLTDNNIPNIIKNKYAVVHIRYGDKLQYSIDDNKDDLKFCFQILFAKLCLLIC